MRTKTVGVSDAEFEEEMARVCEEVEASLPKEARGNGKDEEVKKEYFEPGLFLGKRGGGCY